MQRREVLKLLAAGAAVSGLSPSLMAIVREAHARAGGAYTLRTLNPQQNAMVVTMTDLIIPATDTPGAKGAKVNEFIDVILTDWAHDEERKAFLDGLAGVDKQSTDLFGKGFNDASAEQQTTLLRAIDDKAMSAHGAARVAPWQHHSGKSRQTTAGQFLGCLQRHHHPRLLHFRNRLHAGRASRNYSRRLPRLRAVRTEEGLEVQGKICQRIHTTRSLWVRESPGAGRRKS